MTKIVKTYSGSIYIVHDDGRVVRDSESEIYYGDDLVLPLTLVNTLDIGGFLLANDANGQPLRSSRIVDIKEI